MRTMVSLWNECVLEKVITKKEVPVENMRRCEDMISVAILRLTSPESGYMYEYSFYISINVCESGCPQNIMWRTGGELSRNWYAGTAVIEM